MPVRKIAFLCGVFLFSNFNLLSANAISINCGGSETRTYPGGSTTETYTAPFNEDDSSGHANAVSAAKSKCEGKLNNTASSSFGEIRCNDSDCSLWGGCEAQPKTVTASGVTSSATCVLTPAKRPASSSTTTGGQLGTVIALPFILFGHGSGPQQWSCTATCSAGSIEVKGSCSDCSLFGCGGSGEPLSCEIAEREATRIIADAFNEMDQAN